MAKTVELKVWVGTEGMGLNEEWKLDVIVYLDGLITLGAAYKDAERLDYEDFRRRFQVTPYQEEVWKDTAWEEFSDNGDDYFDTSDSDYDEAVN